MLTKILCWLGLHAWAYNPAQLIYIVKRDEPRRCYRCGRLEDPWAETIAEDAERVKMADG